MFQTMQQIKLRVQGTVEPSKKQSKRAHSPIIMQDYSQKETTPALYKWAWAQPKKIFPTHRAACDNNIFNLPNRRSVSPDGKEWLYTHSREEVSETPYRVKGRSKSVLNGNGLMDTLTERSAITPVKDDERITTGKKLIRELVSSKFQKIYESQTPVKSERKASNNSKEYVCIGCENKNLASEKRQLKERERSMEKAQEAELYKKIQEEFNKLKAAEEQKKREQQAQLKREMEGALTSRTQRKSRSRQSTGWWPIESTDHIKAVSARKEKCREKMRQMIQSQFWQTKYENDKRKDVLFTEHVKPREEEAKSLRPKDDLRKEIEAIRRMKEDRLREEQGLERTINEMVAKTIEEENREKIKERIEKAKSARSEYQASIYSKELKRVFLLLGHQQCGQKEENASKVKERQESNRIAEMQKVALWEHLKQKAEERKKLARELEQQITSQNKQKIRAKMENWSHYEKNNNTQNSNKRCPHGKVYVCTECHRKYPRKMVSKKPLATSYINQLLYQCHCTIGSEYKKLCVIYAMFCSSCTMQSISQRKFSILYKQYEQYNTDCCSNLLQVTRDYC
eukprot:TRINITY_DN105121_c0_g1_i1.p2 TRINITY_DN105121_c0_g1~~TRINITY_DN105121_c0_g1_i1.p2  ORF type:complete len:569 (-),score=29.98 TRINITY_DN105121_c0_g1_i1:3106-4812(-)